MGKSWGRWNSGQILLRHVESVDNSFWKWAQEIDILHSSARGSRRVRNFFTPTGAIFFGLLMNYLKEGCPLWENARVIILKSGDLMRYSMLNACIAGTRLSSSKMRLLGNVLTVRIQFTIIGEITVVVNGAHQVPHIKEISVPNSESQNLGILGTMFDCFSWKKHVYKGRFKTAVWGESDPRYDALLGLPSPWLTIPSACILLMFLSKRLSTIRFHYSVSFNCRLIDEELGYGGFARADYPDSCSPSSDCRHLGHIQCLSQVPGREE